MASGRWPSDSEVEEKEYGYTRKAWLTRPMGGRRSKQP